MKSEKGSRYKSTLSLTLAQDRGGWSIPRLAILFSGKRLIPIVLVVRWALGLVWMGGENFAATGIPHPDRPAHSESLYGLSYPNPQNKAYKSTEDLK